MGGVFDGSFADWGSYVTARAIPTCPSLFELLFVRLVACRAIEDGTMDGIGIDDPALTEKSNRIFCGRLLMTRTAFGRWCWYRWGCGSEELMTRLARKVFHPDIEYLRGAVAGCAGSLFDS
jgi:hypothetical protein